ncbi:hypothetical protein Ddc_14988 [Ditylenchus destructor]|nr:hypothetical protein Ddc_14988 [Ditylenchus destructor]
MPSFGTNLLRITQTDRDHENMGHKETIRDRRKSVEESLVRQTNKERECETERLVDRFFDHQPVLSQIYGTMISQITFEKTTTDQEGQIACTFCNSFVKAMDEDPAFPLEATSQNLPDFISVPIFTKSL